MAFFYIAVDSARRRYYREIITAALILSVAVVFGWFQTVHGASFTGERDLNSNSRPSVVSNHEFRIVVPTTWGAAFTTFFIRLNGLYTTPPNDRVDYDVHFSSGGGVQTIIPVDVGATVNTLNTWQARVENNTLLYFLTSNSAQSVPAANDTLVIRVGTNANTQGVGDTQWTNPAKLSGDGPGVASIISIDFDYNAGADTGRTLVAIIEGVTVSATVSETLTVNIDAGTVASCDSTFRAEADATVNATTVSYGGVSAATFYHGCHVMRVSTNAASGYSATSQENSALQIASTTTTIDDFNESSANPTTAGAWGTSEGFGYACVDQNGGTPCESLYTNANSLYRPFANVSQSATPATFLAANNPTTTTSIIEYRLNFTATQPAGSYTNIITYVFTPTF